jgi:predicted  nucleic acid-binding Zn-ribbon protein
MRWRCSSCGESHDDPFRSCWRCGSTRAATAAELDEEEHQLRADAEEDAAADAQASREAAAASYEVAAGWQPTITADRASAAGAALHRLVVAYRLYRERQDASTRRARPDLDRLWTQFFLSCAVFGGLLISTLTRFSVLDYLAPHPTLFGVVIVGGLLACVGTGQRAVRRELRAEAEAAVEEGRAPVRRVT